MRRLISYVAICSAMILGSAVAMTPTVIHMNTDAAYRDGKTLTFRVSHDIEGENGGSKDYNPEDETALVLDSTEAVEGIASIMRNRLDGWGLAEYTLDTVGFDTITVSLRTNNNDATEYGYLEQYLAFSGHDFELDASITSSTDYAPKESWGTMLDYENAWIEYVDQKGYSSFPVVCVPLFDEDTNYEDLEALVEYCEKNTVEANQEEGTEGQTCSLIVWANRRDNDKYENAASDKNVSERIIVNEAVSNGSALYYASDDEEKETPSLQIIPPSAAVSSGSYDPTKASEAYGAARFLLNLFHADEFKVGVNSYNVTFLYSQDCKLGVEPLFVNGWDQSIAFSWTFIASLVALAAVAILLIALKRVYALQIMANATVTLFGTVAFFVAFGSQFNIAALFGLLIVGLVSVFQGLSYTAKVNDELYKGRTIRKAHQEGVRKAVGPIIDSSVVSILVGIFTFIFAGDVVSKAAIVLVVGGFISAVVSLLMQRILGWMLANDSEAQAKFPSWINVKKDRVPDAIKEEKQTYFGAYADKDFTKKKGLIAIIAGAVIVAGIAMISVFGAVKGNVYNDAAYTAPETVLYIEARSEDSSTNTNKINSVTALMDEHSDDCILKYVTLDGVAFSELYEEITEIDDVLTVHDSEENVNYYWHYYTVSFKEYYDVDGTYNLSVAGDNYDTLSDAFTAAIEHYGATNFNVYVKETAPQSGVPYIGDVFLGVGLGIAAAAVYMCIRHGLSKGLASGAAALSASFISTAFFVITRISVTPIVALGSVGVAVVAFMLSIVILSKGKDLVKESREKDKETLEAKLNCYKVANSREAGEFFLFALAVAYALIAFFAIGPKAYGTVYLDAIIGLVFAFVLTLSCMVPFANWLARQFSKVKIKLPEKKKKKLGQLESNKKSAEPEEAIFIGIND